MTDWSFDISQAPRGLTIPQEQMRRQDGKLVPVIVNQFVPEWIWAATRKGEVIRSHWLPADGKHRPNGRWLNLATDEQPVAWMRYVVPSHPGIPSPSPEIEKTPA